MNHLVLHLIHGFVGESDEGMGMWLFLSVGAVSLFVVFIPLVTWIDNRRKEREAFYRADTMRRLAESSGEVAKAAIELLREQDRLDRIKKLEGLKIGGVINLCVGVALVIFMRIMLGGGHGPAYAGLVPAFLGIGMLVYVFFLAVPVE